MMNFLAKLFVKNNKSNFNFVADSYNANAVVDSVFSASCGEVTNKAPKMNFVADGYNAHANKSVKSFSFLDMFGASDDIDFSGSMRLSENAMGHAMGEEY